MWLSNDSKTNALIEPRTVKHSSNETSDFNDRLINNSFAHCFNSAHSQTKTRNDSHTDNVKAQQSQHIKPEIQILLLLQMGASNSIPLLLRLHFYNTFRVLLRTSKLNHCVVGLHRLGGRWWMQCSCWRTHRLPVESRPKWDSFDFHIPYNNQHYLNCHFPCDHDWCWNSYGMKWSFLLPGRQLNIHVCAQGKCTIREVVSPERLQAEVCCKTVEPQLAVEEGNMCSKWQQQLKMRANELNVATKKKTF